MESRRVVRTSRMRWCLGTGAILLAASMTFTTHGQEQRRGSAEDEDSVVGPAAAQTTMTIEQQIQMAFRSGSGRSFRVVQQPLQFVGYAQFDPESRLEQGRLESVTEITIRDNDDRVVRLDAGLRVDRDEIVTAGAVLNTGAAPALLIGSTGRLFQLAKDQGLVVTTAGEVTCESCAAISVSTCGKGCVFSVSCGADGSCNFTCKISCNAE